MTQSCSGCFHKDTSHDYQWQLLLIQGNEYFQNQQWQQAEQQYSEAFDLLAAQFDAQLGNGDIMMAWICTCHNLSSLYEAWGRQDDALRFLLAPHEHLRQLIETLDSSEQIRLTLMRGMSITIPAIQAFATKYPICEGCIALYPSLKTIVEQTKHVIH
ncbi:hypothetical protein G3R49_17140 [Shewanella sp. WXL01]|uniref:hypothetical protein n=1 Tax=Shewanella sp. WXL01 TaxID=2709721 RepID=UPI0014385F4E|nr:hypothetical protein [Shewanella sp. WXL01]NKF52287.1 hypothetical protein [Shewanella sp. WXL01]